MIMSRAKKRKSIYSHLWSVDGTSTEDDFFLSVDRVSLSTVLNVDTSSTSVAFASGEIDLGDESVWDDEEVPSTCVREEISGSAVRSSRVSWIDVRWLN